MSTPELTEPIRKLYSAKLMIIHKAKLSEPIRGQLALPLQIPISNFVSGMGFGAKPIRALYSQVAGTASQSANG